MMYATNSNLQTEVAGAGKTYGDALSEAWRFLDNVKKVGYIFDCKKIED